ncbi:hypothetical protein E4U37_003609 [Claviceps purpurea]|nr:hypothetical protein E4U37_003609 [Claviceps purpurea]
MAQRHSSYPLPSPSDPSGKDQPDRQRAKEQNLSTGSTVTNSSKAEDTSIMGEPTLSPVDTVKFQLQLSDYRARLARDLELRELSARGVLTAHSEKARVSPISEEDATMSSPMLTAAPTITTASTESGKTLRGDMPPAAITQTPSYPFPRIPSFSQQLPKFTSRRPMSPLSRQRPMPSPEKRRIPDRVLSDLSTPASTFSFEPAGTVDYPRNDDFPSPNLYDLSLSLSAEPGLDAWWSTVVQIMRDVYKAERVTLAVPADTTDIENVPWGQRATFNARQEDELSVGYLARGSSSAFQPGEFETVSDGLAASYDGATHTPTPTTPVSASLSRPGIQSRHSFTAFEGNRPKSQDQSSMGPPSRPTSLTRSKTQYSALHVAAEVNDEYTKLNQHALDEHDAAAGTQQRIPTWEAPFLARYDGHGRVLPVLQALDYEADPLIDHTGIMRVLERGHPVALTRTYPYLPESEPGQGNDHRKSSLKGHGIDFKRPKKQPAESASTLLSFFPGFTSRNKGANSSKAKTITSCLDDEDRRPKTPKYEEYEQAPPSPWSQSPAPSPAVRNDSQENPFFTDATVDEDSFNPGSSPTTYTGMRPPQAIGVDNSWTVLHIPLKHVLLSKPMKTFRLDASALENKSQSRAKDGSSPDRKMPPGSGRVSPEQPKSKEPAPIAILSILTPIIPYPSNLRRSLELLAPHMATSFSMCRHYSNLETELAGIRRRRPSITGFGAVAPYSNRAESAMYLAPNSNHLHSFGGSITSPSDYSAISKSATASPMATPGWEHGPLSHVMDRRQPLSSPSGAGIPAGESYFASRQRPSSKQEIMTPSISKEHVRVGSKDSSSGVEKKCLLPLGVRFENEASSSEQISGQGDVETLVPSTSAKIQKESGVALASGGQDSMDDPSTENTTPILPPPRPTTSTTLSQTATSNRNPDCGKADRAHHHTVLHSYGADFASTFQSLPPSSSLSTRMPTHTQLPAPRSGSLTCMVGDMPPPSDRLKGLILDSLPAHVFVSLPQTGETVWVNSRFLSYRGQTVADLSADPWGSIHPDDKEGYLKAWGHSLRTGEQFSRSVRIKRFDGAYRWFYARAVASKDKRGVIMQFLGSYMDIHDQHIAELKAARQEEIEASEAKHRLLANLIPQIIFTATEDDGITFANDQWLSYTGQSFENALGIGFMDYVHPDDLMKCRIPMDRVRKPSDAQSLVDEATSHDASALGRSATPTQRDVGETSHESSSAAAPGEFRLSAEQSAPSRASSSGSDSISSLPTSELAELARKGIIKVSTDTSGRPSYTTELRLRSKTGDYRWHLIRCVEIDTFDFGRGASSYFGSATDINDHKLLETKLKEAMETKGRFLSNMSHEIRTPLIGISGMVSFLQDTTLNEEQLDYANTIQTSANSLIMIINDILDLSKVDAGMMKLQHEWFHTRSLIEDVNELVSAMAISKHLELNYLVEADVPAWVKGDKVRIRQVLLNVIGNAVKFTSKGEIFSRCKIYTGNDNSTACEENGIMLHFSVIDTGIGFTKQESELIFKPFSQIDGSSTRQHGGSGLGLVISRQLVELHGGKMEGTAVPGEGSTFSFTAKFTLPSADDFPKNPASPAETAESVIPPGKSARFMWDPSMHDSAREEAIFKATSALSNPLTALAAAATGSPEIYPHLTRPLGGSSPLASVNVELARFREAAKANEQDLSLKSLDMPLDNEGSLCRRRATPEVQDPDTVRKRNVRPSMYSILLICPQNHSREATTQHIEMTLPKGVPFRITAVATVKEAEPYIGGDDPATFTHIVLNLGWAEAIVNALDQITKSQKTEGTTFVVLTDTLQRQVVQMLANDANQSELLTENLITYIYKPVKPSRFAVIFDPDKVQDLSVDRNRSTAQRMVENQKASYREIEKRMGNKGYRVLLVEDNPVNQKVLDKYLKKIVVDVELAVDGAECVEIVLSKPHKYYSLILCDLHMPRKDGYQACREIRQWEQANGLPAIPMIALSANVMSDVHEKCVAAGFSDYVTKPVDFIDLSRAMANFF